MACFSDSQLLRIATAGLAAVPGAMGHLSTCDRCGSALENICSRSDQADLRIGRYLVLGEFGRGRFGVVYDAYDPDLDRNVALKVIPRDRRVPDAEILVQEARAMARVDHPNVVTCFDAQYDDERVVLAMRAVKGQRLDHWQAQAQPDSGRARAVCAQIAEGIAAIHAAGLVHRDIKSSNILVGEDDRAFITDFGLATPAGQVYASTIDASHDLSQSTAFAGTPRYMAPEVLSGQPASARSDVWALGLVCIEAFTGKRIFADTTTVDELIVSQGRGASEQNLRNLGIPRSVSRALARCLISDVSARTVTAAELAESLSPRRLRRLRRRRLAIVAALVSVAAAVFIGRYWTQREVASAHEGKLASCIASVAMIADRIGPLPDTLHPVVRHRLDRIQLDIKRGGTQSCHDTEAGDQSAQAHRVITRCYHRIAVDIATSVRSLSVDATKATRLGQVADVSSWTPRLCTHKAVLRHDLGLSGSHYAAVARLEGILFGVRSALERNRAERVAALETELVELVGDVPDELGRGYLFMFRAEVAMHHGKWQELVPRARKWLASLGDSRLRLRVWRCLFESLGALGRLDEAQLAVLAQAKLVDDQGRHPIAAAELADQRARLAWNRGELVEAERGHREALVLLKTVDDPIRLAYAHKNLGLLLDHRRQHGESVTHLQQAEHLLTTWHGPQDVKALRVRAALANVAFARKDYDRAYQSAMSVLSDARATGITNERFVSAQNRLLADIFVVRKDYENAQVHLARAKARASRMPESREYLEALASDARFQFRRRQRKALMSVCRELLQRIHQARVPTQRALFSRVAECAGFLDIDDPKGKWQRWQKMRKLAESAKDPTQQSWADTVIGDIHYEAGRYDQARAAFARGLSSPASASLPGHIRSYGLLGWATLLRRERKFSASRDKANQALRVARDSSCVHASCNKAIKVATLLLSQLDGQ